MILSSDEQRHIVEKIAIDFTQRVAEYDFGKYPETPYSQFLARFRNPSSITCDDITKALIWKWGHWRKNNYPEAHKTIIRKICKEWSNFAASSTGTARDDFDFWTETLQGHHSFITVCYLVHLLHGDKVAILDQHNFRAMNHLLSMIRGNWVGKKAPSNFVDLMNVSDFIEQIVRYWSSLPGRDIPDKRAVDKYLMVLGQKLKSRQ